MDIDCNKDMVTVKINERLKGGGIGINEILIIHKQKHKQPATSICGTRKIDLV